MTASTPHDPLLPHVVVFARRQRTQALTFLIRDVPDGDAEDLARAACAQKRLVYLSCARCKTTTLLDAIDAKDVHTP